MNVIKSYLAGCCLLLTVLLVPTTTQAEGWGDFKGQILFDGTIKPVPNVVDQGAGVANPDICSVKAIPSEELVINPKTKGIANCVIWLSKKPKTVHPDLVKPAKAVVKVDNKNCAFVPHVVVLRTDQVLNAINSDGCSHNVKSNFINNTNANPILTPKDKIGHKFSFKKSEFVPMQLQCSIHSWMQGYCHVLDHPYFAVSDKDGKFEIKNLPEGKHTFIVWQEKVGFLSRRVKAKIENGKTVEETLTYEAKKFD